MMAKREHIKNIGPVYEEAMRKAGNPKVDAIAVTVGPGLEPALWVGITFAEELAKKLKVPVIPVNHMEGHIFSIFPSKSKTFKVDIKAKIFPMLSLLISGGHTEIVLAKEFGKYKIIGATRDDAAGEAFDKVARMLGLPYPGGPAISKLAKDERRRVASGSLAQTDGASREIFHQKNISADRSNTSSESGSVILPRPMIHSKDFDFSFSGLKTAVLYHIRDHGPLTEKMKLEIAKEFEDAVTDVLVSKTLKAVEKYKAKTLIVGGGVSANTYLQKVLKKKLKALDPKITIHFPTKSLSTDNALMIAIAGYFQSKKKGGAKLKAVGNLAL
jgi:N6-L-threonylcarbamoyladenine synthase